MRRLLSILFLILLIHSASAFEAIDHDEQTITVGGNMSVATRTIELKAVSESQVIVILDKNTTKFIHVNGSERFEGVEVNITDIFYVSDPQDRMATILLTVFWKHMCNSDADCEQGLACSTLHCTGWPRRCDYDDSYENITSCINNDSCCPSQCSYLTDTDCTKPCYKDKDCNDGNPGTLDHCDGDTRHPGKCYYSENKDCQGGDDFCPVTCEPGYNGENADSDCSGSNECSYNTNCTALGKIGTCEGNGTDENPRVCKFKNITECISNDNFCPPINCDYTNDNDCIQPVMCGDNICETIENCSSCKIDCGCEIGTICSKNGECVEETRVCDTIGDVQTLSSGGTFYCSELGWKILKAGNSVCQENYECQSKVCNENNKCVSVSKIEEKKSQKVALFILGGFMIAVIIYLTILFKIKRKSQNL